MRSRDRQAQDRMSLADRRAGDVKSVSEDLYRRKWGLGLPHLLLDRPSTKCPQRQDRDALPN